MPAPLTYVPDSGSSQSQPCAEGTSSLPDADLGAPVEPAPKPGGIDFSTWTYNTLPERTGNVGWQPDLQDLIYTAINHVEGDYEDADENCAEQVIERLVLAIKELLSDRSALLREQLRSSVLLGAMKEARDLLLERRRGSEARSPGRNARLALDDGIAQAETA